MSSENPVQDLPEEESLALLEGKDYGRLVFSVGGEVEIFPSTTTRPDGRSPSAPLRAPSSPAASSPAGRCSRSMTSPRTRCGASSCAARCARSRTRPRSMRPRNSISGRSCRPSNGSSSASTPTRSRGAGSAAARSRRRRSTPPTEHWVVRAHSCGRGRAAQHARATASPPCPHVPGQVTVRRCRAAALPVTPVRVVSDAGPAQCRRASAAEVAAEEADESCRPHEREQQEHP